MTGGFSARPKRSLGQNFLTDPNVARKIVASLGIEPGDAVLEIGPGRGALTGFLMESGAGKLMALEKDSDLAPELARRWPGLLVVNADALEFAWERLDALTGARPEDAPPIGADPPPSVSAPRAMDRPGVRIVGNLPYNVASPIMWDIASRCRGFARAVFMVQLEVAERIVAVPRTKDYGGLTVWLQSHVRAEKLFKVPPGVFTPKPKVDSAVVAFTPRPAQERPADPEGLARLIKRLFAMRRKQLGRILGPSLTPAALDYLAGEGLGSASRPEELAPDTMRKLLDYLH